MWEHNYDPFGNPVISTLVAAVPIVVLLIMIGVLRKPAWMSALAGLGTALVVATVAYGMPAEGLALFMAGGQVYEVTSTTSSQDVDVFATGESEFVG